MPLNNSTKGRQGAADPGNGYSRDTTRRAPSENPLKNVIPGKDRVKPQHPREEDEELDFMEDDEIAYDGDVRE